MRLRQARTEVSENPLHYMSDVPCKKCKGRTRYKTTRGCVPCQKAHTKRKRASAVSAAPNADRAKMLKSAGNAARKVIEARRVDDGSDLLIAHLLDDGSDLL